jgi:hypothetical protein
VTPRHSIYYILNGIPLLPYGFPDTPHPHRAPRLPTPRSAPQDGHEWLLLKLRADGLIDSDATWSQACECQKMPRKKNQLDDFMTFKVCARDRNEVHIRCSHSSHRHGGTTMSTRSRAASSGKTQRARRWPALPSRHVTGKQHVIHPD